jgi:hypothetical protein
MTSSFGGEILLHLQGKVAKIERCDISARWETLTQ